MSSTDSAVIDGVNVDALAAAVRSCRGVDDLDRGLLGSVATYLPGRRQLAGIRIGSDRVTVQVRAVWGVPVRELATQIHTAAASLVGGRMIDIVVSDLSDPALPLPTSHVAPLPTPELGAGRQRTLDSAPVEDNHELWTTTAADAPNAARSSAPTTPTAGVRLSNS